MAGQAVQYHPIYDHILFIGNLMLLDTRELSFLWLTGEGGTFGEIIVKTNNDFNY